MSAGGAQDPLLAEQIAHYRAVANEYEHHAIPSTGAGEVGAALEAFAPAGDVLERACGPGMWTERLLAGARSFTAVDASPEMIARAEARVGAGRVRFVQADLFGWEPDRRYDVVFFGFWISHVPIERFEAFWSMIGWGLAPSGRVLFVDDAFRPPEELVLGAGSDVVERRLKDETAFHIVKVPHEPADLERRLRGLGWGVLVRGTKGPFSWGEGGRAAGR